jgi:lipooligosaccharide transport system permease protein
MELERRLARAEDAPVGRAAMVTAARPLEHLVLFWSKGIRRSLLVGIVIPAAFLGAMGLGVGSMVGEQAEARRLGGFGYLEFLAPGMMAVLAMQAAVQESLWPVLGGIKWRRTYEAMLATPLEVDHVLRGQLAYTCLRVGFAAVLYLLVMTAFGVPSSALVLLTPLVAVLTGLAFAAPVTAFSATQETDIRFPLIFRLGVMPLFLFSGAFFPLEQLPVGIQVIAKVAPLWHGIELCRGLTLGTIGLLPAAGHLGYLLLWAAAGVAAGHVTFERRLRP